MLATRAAALKRASGCAGLMLAVISASSCDVATPSLANDAPPAPGPTAHLPPKGSDALAPPDAGVPCNRTPKPADGICSRVRVSCGVLDPDCVYVMGTLEESVAGQDVLIDPQDPSDRAYGFGMQRAMAVHPKTGELWFTASSGSSGAPWGVYIHQINKWADAINPQLTFQRRIATPRCPEQVSPFEHFLFADDGALAYICSGRPLGLVNILGQPEGFDMQLYEPLALGRDRAVFGGTTGNRYAILRQDGTLTPLQGWDNGYSRFVAARSRPEGGFLLAAFHDDLSADGSDAKLFVVGVDGSLTVLGAYNRGDLSLTTGPVCSLDASGALYCSQPNVNALSGPGEIVGGVVRFRLDGPPRVVYDERTSAVKLHIPQLVTGP